MSSAASKRRSRTSRVSGCSAPVPFAPGHKVGHQVEPSGCWRWIGAYVNGYGMMGIPKTGRTNHAHRIYWERVHGPVPNGVEPDHLCRNRWCVNPAHMELVTRRINAQRGAKAKLNPEKVRAIRALVAAGGTTQRQIGLLFGVTNSTVSRVASGDRKHWINVV